MKKPNPIICAIDTKNVKEAVELAKKIKPEIGVIKLGLEFFTINGPQGIKALKECGLPIFLDLKFHDIPNTVAQSVRGAVQSGVDMLTIHTSGGKEMMRAAAEAARDESTRLNIKKPLILGVTILTSMDNGDLSDIGIKNNVETQVVTLARLAVESGLDGVVCSPLEIGILKKEFGSKLKLVVPGIRPDGGGGDDQKRVMTPSEAINKGADYIVIGRPITQSEDPGVAAKKIRQGISEIL